MTWVKEIDVEGKQFTRKVCSPATLLTVFGIINFSRYCYYSDSAESIKALDMKANLPARQASYFVQDLVSRLGIKYTTYDEARKFFKDLFSHGFSKHTLEEIVLDSAKQYENYDVKKPLPDKESEGEFCAVQADGKGVRVLPGENPKSKGKTKEALVGAVYTVNPHIRGAQEVACSLITPELLTKKECGFKRCFSMLRLTCSHIIVYALPSCGSLCIDSNHHLPSRIGV